MAVVAIPLTTVDASPALKPSGPVVPHSPPSSAWMRRTTPSAVSGSAPSMTNGAAPALPAIRANCLREILDCFIIVLLHGRLSQYSIEGGLGLSLTVK